jgi:hypothetical protein
VSPPSGSATCKMIGGGGGVSLLPQTLELLFSELVSAGIRKPVHRFGSEKLNHDWTNQ